MTEKGRSHIGIPFKTLFYIVCLLAVVAFVGYHIYGMLSADVVSVRAIERITKESVTLKGYLARNEVVIAEESGSMLFSEYSDGAKLKAGELAVSAYSNGGESFEKVKEIALIKKKLAILSQAMNYESERDIDKRISLSYSELMKKYSGGRSDSEGELDALTAALSSREYFFDRESVRDAYSEAEKKLGELKSSLGSADGSYKMPISGYFFGSGDEFGGLFTESLAKGGTADEILSNIATYNNSEKSGKSIAVAAESSEWYLLCPANEKEVSAFVKGRTYDVTVGTFELRASLLDVRAASEGERCVLVLSFGSLPQGFSYDRCSTVELSSGDRRTYRIPSSAIRTSEDGTRGVYVVSGGVVLFRRVEIVKSGDNYVLVKSEKSYKEEQGSEKSAEALYGEIPPLSAGIYRGNTQTSVTEENKADDGTVLVKRDTEDARINTFSEEDGGEFKYLEENEQIIISEGKLYHGKILG